MCLALYLYLRLIIWSLFTFKYNNVGVVELKDLSPIFYVFSLDCILAHVIDLGRKDFSVTIL